jgi:hypothetical protein
MNRDGRPCRELTSPRARGRVLAAVILACALVGSSACSGGGDEAAPVAAVTATLPSGAVPAGRAIDLTLRFAVAPEAPPFTEDHVVFVHALNASGERVWTADHEPATPTRQWKPGAVVEYTRPMMVSRRLEGPVRIEVGLYSVQTGERLPLSGKTNGLRAYEVGTLTISKATDETATVFVEGWHDVEAPEGAQGLEWHWSTGKATLWLRNPKRDALFVIDLDQPATAFSEVQHVTIRNGAAVLDSFDLRQGKREIRRVRLAAADFGDDAMARVTIEVDKTFVPARLPGGSADTRELGVRVFDAHLESARETP